MSDFLFKEDTREGKYPSYDDDSCIGFECPSLAKLELIGTEEKLETLPEDKITIFLFWAQYSKPGYKFMPLYSQLQDKYKDKVKVIGISTDPTKDLPEKFLDDPKGKYAKAFETSFTIGWDSDGSLKEAFAASIRKTLSIPHAFVFVDGKVAWHQEHSEIGATAPTYMYLMEKQIKSLLDTGKAVSVGNGPEESDSEESDEGDAVEGDLDLF